MNHFVLISLIIVGTGIFGGFTSFLISYESNEAKWLHFFRSIVLGLSASAVVPLMLYFLLSDLINKAESNTLLYFVFGAFCLVFALFAKTFLNVLRIKLLDTFMGVKNMVNKHEDFNEVFVKRNSDESEEINYPISEFRLRKDVREKMQDFINELKKPKYSFRTFDGLMKSTNINSKILSIILEELERVSIVSKVIIKKRTYYTLLNKNVNVTL